MVEGKPVMKDGKTVTEVKYCPYDLRHFFASMLFENKANLKKIQTVMGHTNIETTLNVYGHLLEDPDKKDTEPVGMLGSLLSNPCGVSVARHA